MPSDLETALETALGFVSQDRKVRTFLDDPYELRYRKHSSSLWLPTLATAIATGAYYPQAVAAVDVPKPSWHVRPGARLVFEDEIVYMHLVLQSRAAVSQRLAWSEQQIRFSHRFSKKKGEIFRLPFKGWGEFRGATIKLLEGEYKFVVIADISGYYENITIAQLMTDLEGAGVAEPTRTLLSKCLNRWAGSRARGIPQSYTASDVLGELYLDNIDRTLADGKFKHQRYLDDIRVFAKTLPEARRALHRLTVLLRERGLNLQTKKGGIFPAQEAIAELDALNKKVKAVSAALAGDVAGFLGSSYASQEQVKKYLQANPSTAPMDVVSAAWAKYVVDHVQGVDKTLLHYLLNRLGDAKAVDALPQVVQLLRERPEETKAVLEYLRALHAGLPTTIVDKVAAILTDQEATFDYQRYEILRWFFLTETKHKDVFEFAHGWIETRKGEHVVRPYALAYVGRFGEPHDLEFLEHEYDSSYDWFEKATIACAFQTAPAGIKNKFYGRVVNENVLVKMAVMFAKSA